ncbi:MAG: hypothetical protein MUF73_15410 [Rhodobacteraceae bacterium]|jgi:hypothetical protein|nr:hypothetical protein [Paracoccaceae bacterium]
MPTIADDISKIIAFAAQVGEPLADPAAVARTRNWLDETGRITADGAALLRSLTDQEGTRTVFRIVQ